MKRHAMSGAENILEDHPMGLAGYLALFTALQCHVSSIGALGEQRGGSVGRRRGRVFSRRRCASCMPAFAAAASAA